MKAAKTSNFVRVLICRPTMMGLGIGHVFTASRNRDSVIKNVFVTELDRKMGSTLEKSCMNKRWGPRRISIRLERNGTEQWRRALSIGSRWTA
jgi:hypothetical protein